MLSLRRGGSSGLKKNREAMPFYFLPDFSPFHREQAR